ncbi:transporter substrate-binding domain-containing protein [Colwellia sp. Arc7-635]|uniref:substrate-binding periplasmic protein n=1 Tax=Colwellia sp. Arc7-635 TaxID=2497879 RepID=UPI000F8544CF|nr:transporter substrate-binding domain-containing protein [Colwellia sp. Arc7-635]AZQ83891.1 transporter substrate-binding domain-containing protein [Colwellia sp. Arc7-635]
MKYLPVLFFFCMVLAVKAKPLTLEVVSEHWPPFIVQDADDTFGISGIVTKNIKAILDPANIDYTISIYPWARSYHLAITKPNVLIYSLYKTKQRAPYFEWFCPIHKKTPVNVYKLKKNQTNIATLPPLKEAIIGVLRDDNSHNYMLNKGFITGDNLIVSANEEINIQRLLKGKIDAIIQSRESLIFRLRATDFTIDDFDVGYQLHQDMNTEHCMALSKTSSPEMISAVRAAFNFWRSQQSLNSD